MELKHFEIFLYWKEYKVLTQHVPGAIYLRISNGDVVDESTPSKKLFNNIDEAVKATLACVQEIYPDFPIFRTLPQVDMVLVEKVPYYICSCRLLKPL